MPSLPALLAGTVLSVALLGTCRVEASLHAGGAPDRVAESLPTSPERYLDLFEPLPIDRAALSPDGKQLALSHRKEGQLWVIITTVDEPQTIRATLLVGEDSSATPALRRQSRELVPLEVSWMGWASENRLVVETNRTSFRSPTVSGGPDLRGEVFSVNADGSDLRMLATPRQLARTKTVWDYNTHHSHILPARILDWDIPGDDCYPPNRKKRNHDRYDRYHHTIPAWEPHPSTPRPVTVAMPIKVLDYSAEHPHEIMVRAGDENDFDLYAINAITGDKRIVRTEHVTGSRMVLLDRQYEANIAVPSTTRTRWPHAYLYDEPRFFSLIRWKKLGEKLEGSIGDADTFSLSPENLMADRSIPLGFDENRDILYFASDVGRETFGIYAADLATGALTDFAIEHPEFDLIPPTMHDFAASENLVYDRFSRNLMGVRYNAQFRTAAWVPEGWNEVQSVLQETFPHSSIDLVEWDRSYTRFLVQVENPRDPGAFYIYDTATRNLLQFGQRGAETTSYPVESVDLTMQGPTGRTIPFRLTVPEAPIHTPVPLVVLYADNFWDRLSVDFDAEAMALARMGYLVVQFSGRGAWGYGRDSRTAFRDGYEMAQAKEVIAIIEYLQAQDGVHPEKVALVGEGIGGYFALRTLQAYRADFRCGVAINAPLDPASWIEKARWGDVDRNAASHLQLLAPYLGPSERNPMAPLLASSASIGGPVLLFAYRKEDGDALAPDYNDASTLTRNLRRAEIPAELVDLHPDYGRGLPHARAEVFAHIAGFLNTHMFDYGAEPRELEVQSHEPDGPEVALVP